MSTVACKIPEIENSRLKVRTSMCVCVCVRVLTKTYLWGSENNQHNKWSLFRQTCGVQNCPCTFGEHGTTGENVVPNKSMYVRTCVCVCVFVCVSCVCVCVCHCVIVCVQANQSNKCLANHEGIYFIQVTSYEQSSKDC